MKRTLLLFALLIGSMSAFCQDDDCRQLINTKMWYFGDHCGIDFNTNPPTALTNGALYALDNTSTVTDVSGDLMFYTNGRSVWNSNHQVMTNGNGMMGSANSSHGSLIVQKPGANDIFYIFTTDSFAAPNGLRYSEVDMSMSGGLGAVTSNKNILLVTPVSEKLIAVKHDNNNDVWIVSHKWGTNEFYSYLVSNTGVSTTPVITAIGSVHSGGSYGTYNAMGQIAANRNGDKIALGIYDLDKFELFDFDNTTGVLSNQINITGYPHAWGVEFSPNGSKLYVSKWTSSEITQFELTNYTQTDIVNSATVVGNATSAGSYQAGFLQIGPDGKLYIAKYDNQYLSVINYPNLAGTACSFVNNGFYLGGKTCKAGLSISPKCLPIHEIEYVDNSCDYHNNTKIWYFGDSCGIDFNTTPPTPITNSAMYALDNTSSITDSSGNILFYTNGRSVWNRNHQVMLNGYGLQGSGNSSHGSLIVPKPGSSSLYYIFTTDSFAGSWGCRYSEVDLLQDNGFGAVTGNKNILLFSPSPEKLTAIKHNNNTDIWIVTHRWGTNEFYSYLLTNQGLSSTPVISNIGSIHSGGSYGTYNAMGQMTASPNGSKLAVAIYDLNKVELFDFDKSTGVLSNLITISPYSNPWGLEFSALGNKLYLSQWTQSTITQFDLSVYNQTSILNSAIVIGNATSTSTYKAGFMQMGADGRIYIAKFDSQYMAIIGDPDQTGTACSFVDNGFYLGGKTCKAGITIGFKCYEDASTSVSHFAETIDIIKVYPNPAVNEQSVIVEINNKSIKAISMYNAIGELVFTKEIGNLNKIEISTENYDDGLYLINAISDKVEFSKKLIIIK